MTIKAANGETINFLQTLPTGAGPFPAMIFLHGNGERGNDLSLVAKFGPPAVRPPGFIILSPQLPLSKGYWEPWIIDEMVTYAKTLKPSMLILTGLSLGGGATLAYAEDHPDLFSCIAPICPACLYDYQKLKNIANIPCWAFVGDKDEVVGPTCTTQIQGPMPKAKVTIIPGGDHGAAWMHGYAIDSGLYAWMLAQYKPVVNPPTPIPVPTPPVPAPTPVPPPPPKPTLVKIPLDMRRMYQINNFDNDLSGLFDGDLNNRPVPGYGQILSPYEARYEFPDEQEAVIYKLRFYDGQGAFQPGHNFEIYGMTADFKRTLLATFDGKQYMTWVEANVAVPTQYKYLVMVIYSEGGGHTLPNEMEIWGTCKPVPEPVIPARPPVPFKNYLGVNMYEWNVLQNLEFMFVSWEVYEPKWNILKYFHQFRHYLSWKKLELERGGYSFQPTRDGNWALDIMYERMASEGRFVNVCIKGLPIDRVNAWPEGQRHSENIPLNKPGLPLDDPNSYSDYADMAFQFAARYGRTIVPLDRISVYTVPAYAGAPVNEKKTGLGWVHAIEIGNERDAWWWATYRRGYQSGREYAAYISKVYDRIKEADPTMMVIIAGSASPRTDWHRAIVDWCKEFRGGKLPFDAYNYHFYPNDSGTSQGGAQTRGVAPEVSVLGKVADQWNWFNYVYGQGKEIWQTEIGYDVDQGSPQKAIPIGGRSHLQTQGDWLIRTALEYSAKKHDRLFFYEFFDNGGGPTIFQTSGFADGLKPRPSLYFVAQMGKLLGDWSFAERISENPRVDRYTLDGKDRFVAWMPTETGATEDILSPIVSKLYQLKVYYLQDDSFDAKEAIIQNDDFVITETPLVYEVVQRSLITEINTLPIADAGKDVEAVAGKTISVSAIGSLDTDGAVKAWKWRKVKGPSKGKISYSERQTTTLTGLVPGTYVFELTVWDDKNGEATDQITVNVK